ncbi:hypothetical protein D1872_221030 [compost metagenome]
MLFRIFGCFRKGVIKGVAHKYHFHCIAPEQLNLGYFLARCGRRHENNAPNAKRMAGVGDALRMVTRTGTYNPLLYLFLRQATYEVIRPT